MSERLICANCSALAISETAPCGRCGSKRFKREAPGESIGDLAKAVMAKCPEPVGGWAEHDEKTRLKVAELDRLDEAKRERAVRANLVSIGVPVKDVDRIALNELRDEPALKVVRECTSGILVLSGRIGCGKTTAAAWWVTQPFESPYLKTRPPLFMPTYKLERTKRYDNDQMKTIELAQRLVIDDLGTEYVDSKDYFQSFVRNIIDARYANSLPLLITTNLVAKRDPTKNDAATFSELYGERVLDRIREVGAFIELDSPSLRRKQK